jgi:hypothetical protein
MRGHQHHACPKRRRARHFHPSDLLLIDEAIDVAVPVIVYEPYWHDDVRLESEPTFATYWKLAAGTQTLVFDACILTVVVLWTTQ